MRGPGYVISPAPPVCSAPLRAALRPGHVSLRWVAADEPPRDADMVRHHEARIAWREWLSMLTAGKPRRVRIVIVAMLGLAAFMHLVAFSIVGKFATIDPDPDR